MTKSMRVILEMADTIDAWADRERIIADDENEEEQERDHAIGRLDAYKHSAALLRKRVGDARAKG